MYATYDFPLLNKARGQSRHSDGTHMVGRYARKMLDHGETVEAFKINYSTATSGRIQTEKRKGENEGTLAKFQPHAQEGHRVSFLS